VSHSTDVGCISEENTSEEIILIGTVVLLTATSAQATFFAAPSGDSRGYPSGGGGLAVPPPNPRTVACLRANGISPVQQNQHVIAMAIRRCIGRGRR
jgi:hypothetical protein